MARHGVPIGDPEFFSAIRAGGVHVKPLPTGIRRILHNTAQQTFGRFEQSYASFLGISRAELWKGMKGGFKDDLGELATTVRNMTGGLDSRALGVGPNAREVESMWLAFSPRLLRSTSALIADLRLGLGSARGREAWRTLGSLVLGTTGTYILSGVALGKSEKEIRDGLNPLSGKKFLAHEIGGEYYGVGGTVRALTQLLGATASAAAPGGRPADDLIATNFYDNPLLSFYGGRGAPAIRVVGAPAEALTGTDFLPYEKVQGIRGALSTTSTAALPFAIQNVLEGQSPSAVAASLTGVRTAPGGKSRAATLFDMPEFGNKAWGEQNPTSDEIDQVYDLWDKTATEINRYRDPNDDKPVNRKAAMRYTGAQEGYSERVISLAVYLSSTKNREAARNPEWLEYVAQNEDYFRDRYPHWFEGPRVRRYLIDYIAKRRQYLEKHPEYEVEPVEVGQ